MGLESGVKTSSFMSDFLVKCGGCAVLDGGFVTELERHGADLNDPLWSAKCLVSSPHLVRRAYAELLEEEAIDIPAWFTFASKDGINVVSGDSIFECASIANACKQVVAVWINCTPPRYIQGWISSIQKVIYPNSGETYDGQSKQWIPSSGRVDEEFAEIVIEKWHEAGASLFGGCCRTTPNTIRAISKALSNKSSAVNDA